MAARRALLPAARPYQQVILNSPARVKLLICGQRWGKTKLGLLAALVGHGPNGSHGSTAPRQRGAVDGARIGWIVPSEEEHPSAAEVWADLKAALPVDARRISESRHRIDLPGAGSVQLWLGFLPNAMRGPFFDGVVIDECSLRHEGVWPVRAADGPAAPRMAGPPFISPLRFLAWDHLGRLSSDS